MSLNICCSRTSQLVTKNSPERVVMPRLFTHGGDLSPQVQGDKALMGGLMRGDIDLMGGGPNFDRLYHKLKVLLLLTH